MQLTRNAFDRLVEDAIAALPPEFARWIDEIPIIVEDEPGKQVRRHLQSDGGELDPAGLHRGAPMGYEQEISGHLPPQIFLYRKPLMESCRTREELAEEIRKTLLHELGHHAGMDEEQLDALGYGPLDEEDDDIHWDLDDDDRSPPRT